MAFCVFLKSEFCEENIEFWLACEDFKTKTSHDAMVSKANSIYEEFIRSEAPKEVKKKKAECFKSELIRIIDGRWHLPFQKKFPRLTMLD